MAAAWPQYFNAGMRGKKTEIWEGGHRVPCFIRWPKGGLGKPRDVGGLTQVQDVLPTLLDLCQIKPSKTAFDGMSLAPTLKENEVPKIESSSSIIVGCPGSQIIHPRTQTQMRADQRGFMEALASSGGS